MTQLARARLPRAAAPRRRTRTGSGYVSLASFTRTIRTSPFSSTSSCITSPPRGHAPRRAAPRSRGCWARSSRRDSSSRPRLIRLLTVPSGRSEPVRHLLVAQPLQVAQHHRLPQLVRQQVEPAAQEAAAVAVLERAMRVAADGGGRQVEGHQVLDQHLPLALAGPVVVDAVVPGHAARARSRSRRRG